MILAKQHQRKSTKKMCSFSWQNFDSNLTLVFNRDESVNRAKALIPTEYQEHGTRYLMPKDPEGQGSWIAANEFGFVFVLLNDYQGQVTATEPFISRGQLIKRLAVCQTLAQVYEVIATWPLNRSQPFQLAMLCHQEQSLWHYDGQTKQVLSAPLPSSLFSSGHPDVLDIKAARKNYLASCEITGPDSLIAIFKSHFPNQQATDNNPGSSGDTFSFCMHRDDARTQSMSLVSIALDGHIKFDYWDGQPCQVHHPVSVELKPAHFF